MTSESVCCSVSVYRIIGHVLFEDTKFLCLFSVNSGIILYKTN